MGSTNPYGLRYPEYGQGADVKLDLQKLAEDVAPKLYRAEPLTSAQITAVASPRIGQLVTNTDTGRVLFWNGTAWRPVGGVAVGSVALGTVTVTATATAFSYFIGLGFEEVQFTFGGPAGNNGAGPQGTFTAVGDATKAQGVTRSGGGSASMVSVFSPVAITDGAEMTAMSDSSGEKTLRLQNLRLTSDGFLRYELITSYANYTLLPGVRFNWKAR